MAVLLGGAMAGFAGALLYPGSVGRFDEMMTAGQGFHRPGRDDLRQLDSDRRLGSWLIVRFCRHDGSKLSLVGSTVPPQFMAMLPYIATMIVLAGVVGKGQMPAADGEPYEKG